MVFLSLRNNSLEGSLPDEIGNLTMLNNLYVRRNNLKGKHKHIMRFLSPFCLISFKKYSSVMFTGLIPSSIFNISSLQVISLGFNKFSAGHHLSSNLFDHLPNLRLIDLSVTQLSGRIPSSLFECKELKYIYLHGNQLEGTIPSEIGNLTSLVGFVIDRNNIVGKLKH